MIYFVVANDTYVLSISVLFAQYCELYLWIPKIVGLDSNVL
jgi:heme/copper-type cytochrome/quinol oxidase subunit 1